jgi:DNA repair photolyase
MFRQATYPLLFVLSPTLTASPGAALERRLRKAARRGEPLVIGTPAAPYDPAGDQFDAARSLLHDLVRTEGLEINLTTRSPRILRDLELLADLDKRHAVSLRVMAPAVAPELQLHAVRALAAEGIATTVFCTPEEPETRDGEEILRRLFAAAAEAGARDVEVDAPALPWGERERLLSTVRRLRLEHGFPRETAGRG